MSSRPRTSIVVMAYNEEEGLEPTVLELHEFMAARGEPHEILIVDDGSQDGTGARAEQLQRTLPGVRTLRHPRNLGLGGVYRTGFEAAAGEWLIFFPADGQLPASNLGPFLEVREGYDLILGVIPCRPVGWLALLLSWVERVLYRLLFGRFPAFQGLMMIRTSVLRSLELRSQGRGWSILMELILRVTRGPYRWTNVDTVIRPRLGGESKVRNLRTILANLRELFRLRTLL